MRDKHCYYFYMTIIKIIIKRFKQKKGGNSRLIGLILGVKEINEWIIMLHQKQMK